MANLFYTADLHFGHSKCYDIFKRPDGNFLRWDLASNVEEGDELLIQRWNSVVRNNDIVIVAGDITINHKHLYKVSRLRGRKYLVMGNHDTASLGVYQEYFDKIAGSMEKDGCVITHIPIHTAMLEHRWALNVHGHTHAHFMKNEYGTPSADYVCVSVEQTNYTPISHEDVKILAKKRGNSRLS